MNQRLIRVCSSLVGVVLAACSSPSSPPTPPSAPPAPVAALPAPAPAAPAAPTMTPEQSAGRKSAMLAEPCNNRISADIRRIRSSYLRQADREAGPGPRYDTISDGIFYFPEGSVPACRAAIQQAVALQPASPDFDTAAPAYLTALEPIIPLLSDASAYYGRQGFRDDAGAHARELHTQLLAAIDAFVAADDRLGDISRAAERAALQARLVTLAADPSKRGEFLVERALGASEHALTLIAALEVRPVAGQRRKFHLVAADAAALAAAVDECQRFVDEMVAAPESATIDTGGSFRASAGNFVSKAVIAGRAVRDDQSESNEATLGTLVNETVGAYNSLVQDYNRI